MNGGTCTERCQSSKEKFTCQCAPGFAGKVCETEVQSCSDILITSRMFPKDGVYWIKGREIFPVFCDFVFPNQSWTLIESFSLEANPFKNLPLYSDGRKNQRRPPTWDSFRLKSSRIYHVRSKSTLFRATCNFQKKNHTLTPDLLIGRLTEYDVIKYDEKFNCRKYVLVNIRGYECKDCYAFTAQNKTMHIHIDATRPWCKFHPPSAIKSEDSFGYYENVNPNSTCTAMPGSTTQWWLGKEISEQ